jgi:hypothetical protein
MQMPPNVAKAGEINKSAIAPPSLGGGALTAIIKNANVQTSPKRPAIPTNRQDISRLSSVRGQAVSGYSHPKAQVPVRLTTSLR